ncbi:hypothetical protein E7X19_26725, partial [Bacteroides fragilis]
GFSVAAMARHRKDTPAGKLQYIRNDAAKTIVPDITTAELGLTLASRSQLWHDTGKTLRPVNFNTSVTMLPKQLFRT